MALTPPPTLAGASPVVELASGVDALYLSGRAKLSSALFEVLDQRRATAVEEDAPVPLELARYEDKISADLFGEEPARLSIEIENLQAEDDSAMVEQIQGDELADHFERLVELLDRIDVGRMWAAATEKERRALLDELLGSVTVLPDRLVVEVHGAPALNVGLSEVGLKEAPHSEFRGVEGGTAPLPTWSAELPVA